MCNSVLCVCLHVRWVANVCIRVEAVRASPLSAHYPLISRAEGKRERRREKDQIIRAVSNGCYLNLLILRHA